MIQNTINDTVQEASDYAKNTTKIDHPRKWTSFIIEGISFQQPSIVWVLGDIKVQFGDRFFPLKMLWIADTMLYLSK